MFDFIKNLFKSKSTKESTKVIESEVVEPIEINQEVANLVNRMIDRGECKRYKCLSEFLTKCTDDGYTPQLKSFSLLPIEVTPEITELCKTWKRRFCITKDSSFSEFVDRYLAAI